MAQLDNWTKKRRSQRLVLSIPIVAYRLPTMGRPFFEGAHTLAVSAHGALISLAAGVAADQRLVLKHPLSGEEQECRVIFIQKKLSGPTEVGIEFRQPAPNFWGIAFPPSDSQASVVNERMLPNMRRIDRREWWLWSSAISVTLLLALGIASFAVPALMAGFDSFHAFFLDQAVRGLIGLVLVFNVYVVYEQVQINRIRGEFAATLYQMAVLDPVTNMFNRRYIMHRLEEEIARCQRHGSPLTLIALDLDCFNR